MEDLVLKNIETKKVATVTDIKDKMNIYDLAGNVLEWTLENTFNDSVPCVDRGGSYGDNSSDYPTSSRNNNGMSYSSSNVGFRLSIY